MKKCIYLDYDWPKSNRVRLGIAELDDCGYSTPNILTYNTFSIRTEENIQKLRRNIAEIVEATGLKFMTPQGLLDSEETGKYLGLI